MEYKYIKFYCNDRHTAEGIFRMLYNKVQHDKKYFATATDEGEAIKTYIIQNLDTGALVKIVHIDKNCHCSTADKPLTAYIDSAIDTDYVTQCILPCCIYTNRLLYYFNERDVESGFDIKF